MEQIKADELLESGSSSNRNAAAKFPARKQHRSCTFQRWWTHPCIMVAVATRWITAVKLPHTHTHPSIAAATNKLKFVEITTGRRVNTRFHRTHMHILFLGGLLSLILCKLQSIDTLLKKPSNKASINKEATSVAWISEKFLQIFLAGQMKSFS